MLLSSLGIFLHRQGRNKPCLCTRRGNGSACGTYTRVAGLNDRCVARTTTKNTTVMIQYCWLGSGCACFGQAVVSAIHLPSMLPRHMYGLLLLFFWFGYFRCSHSRAVNRVASGRSSQHAVQAVHQISLHFLMPAS